jgi:hypothetical protein
VRSVPLFESPVSVWQRGRAVIFYELAWSHVLRESSLFDQEEQGWAHGLAETVCYERRSVAHTPNIETERSFKVLRVVDILPRVRAAKVNELLEVYATILDEPRERKIACSYRHL